MGTKGLRYQGGGASLFNDRSDGAGVILYEDVRLIRLLSAFIAEVPFVEEEDKNEDKE